MRVLYILFILSLASCDNGSKLIDAKKASSVSSSSGTSGGGDDNPFCTGTADDGIADQNYPQSPLFLYQFSLANGATWSPGTYPIATDVVAGVNYKNLPLGEAFSFFQNDGPNFIRIKLTPMRNFANNLEKGCWNRQTPGASPIVGYTKLKFRVNAFTITSNGAGGYTKGTPVFVGDYTADLSNCSPIIKIPNLSGLNPNTQTAFEVTQLLTDTNCLAIDHSTASEDYKAQQRLTYCPVSTSPKTSCVEGVIEVSTNRTHFFKGHSRSDF